MGVGCRLRTTERGSVPNRVRRRELPAGAVGAAAVPSEAGRAGAEGGDTARRSGSAGRALAPRDDADAIM